ncbi:zinc-dependent alcohol dehydrogenase family protein [Humidisolicoccus flavus]|uniref:zinc-dependent alcohol dehydrogenase family protein n=1 Tax=Humidisolicoccus flavus TaxID=3111414 RepID=UPI0032485A31
MKAVILHAAGDVQVEERETPTVLGPKEVVVKVSATCVCGSDLWSYRGDDEVTAPRAIGHEFVGIVHELGDEVQDLAVGDFVISPFYGCDNECANCQNGVSSACQNLTWYGSKDRDGHALAGAQGEYVRVPDANGTLVRVPGQPSKEQIPGLLTLADVMGTGHHAAVSAGVQAGDTVVVIGDGAVGLCAVIAAKRLGASEIIVMSRHEPRQALARTFGATQILAERGEEAVAAVRALTNGVGADRVLECVGTAEALTQAVHTARPGGSIGFVGVPHGDSGSSIGAMFGRNVSLAGGVAPVRGYIEELLPEVLDGSIEPGRVFDLELPLEEAAEAYSAMAERRAIKSLLWPSAA